MNRFSKLTQQVVPYLVVLGIFLISLLAFALYRGRQATRFSQDVDYVGHLRASALLFYVAEHDLEGEHFQRKITLAEMRAQVRTLQERYPRRSVQLVLAWQRFDKEARGHITWRTAQNMAVTADAFSQIINDRANDEARGVYWILIFSGLGLLLLLTRGFILARDLHYAVLELHSSERRFAILSEATSEGVIMSENGVIKDANSQIASLLGYTVPEIIGHHLFDFVHPKDKDIVKRSIENNSEEIFELICVRKDKSTFAMEISPRVFLQPNGKCVRLTVGRDITDRKELERYWRKTNKNLTLSRERWRELAVIDDLTGAYTRRIMRESLCREVRRASYSGLPFSIMMLDLDNFKLYNDSFGHVAGDELLRHIVSILRDTVREIDIISRYGGDEFIVILVGTGAMEAKAVANQCLQRIRDIPQMAQVITVSIGLVTCYMESSASIDQKLCDKLTDDILRQVDQVLYRSKESGRNQVTVAPDFYVEERSMEKTL